MKEFIKNKGMEYITKAINPKSGTPYFMFEKSKRLDEIISEWNQVKK